MGGYNSTRWNDVTTRSVVEECYSLLAPRLGRGSLGERPLHNMLRWERSGFEVGCTLVPTTVGTYLWLTFCRYGKAIEQGIELCTTRPHFGGLRWWFVCPRCRGRAGRLHLPPGSTQFWCRACHGLSYESAQGSRGKTNGLWKVLADGWGCSTRVARDNYRAISGGIVYSPRQPHFAPSSTGGSSQPQPKDTS